ncbi:Methionine aminopeptidase 1 [Cricetulus griseus]|uniref:Methionine aminopeptidase 1 n=1 Tax=Cricetulus griseus TaxID=10029 RepID=G3IMD2_CRIGR|nr:Methionine aminopeptidase 1 [Cricetulus griseus]
MQAIDAVKPGVRYRELGNIIQKHAQANGFSVVRSYCGHGIHKLFHTAPNVPHYASEYYPNIWIFLFMNKYSSMSQGFLYCIH